MPQQTAKLFYGKRLIVVPVDPAISDNEDSEKDNDVADPNFIQLTYNLDIPCPSDMGHSAKSKYVQLAVEEFEDDNDDNKDENENKVKSAPHAKGPTKNGKPAARLTTWKKVDLDNQDLPEH
ncbi:hypothetical protein KOW79_000147 [Hemibagrus wyckioides]|uniref:Uncharacterized protein n=1 Tax=Hemibagrus wyckioides TaxID=337641 RepID=A0A9D3P7J2_9TELE|nr:hypothetical protein KOW79_000147 [Hemibagrus wyckioides]